MQPDKLCLANITVAGGFEYLSKGAFLIQVCRQLQGSAKNLGLSGNADAGVFSGLPFVFGFPSL